tara:strand:- start:291 stop:566 length:276 start_codon:yes stop_codon:yes gene_type:complete
MSAPWYEMEEFTLLDCENDLSKFYSRYVIKKVLKNYNSKGFGSYRNYYTFIEPELINKIAKRKKDAEQIIQRFIIHKVLPLYKLKNKIDNN